MRERPGSTAKVRCAIYTRKSTEEGLDQEFNSLDAQREAGAAYILSQKHEGWQLLPDFYDDGGYSGGNMDRPGLKQLLADVEAGRVDVIVVYKVDRLTRSLADFAKILEVLDARGASFVSVTQAFNTTTSMGRLTLNVLLSFAQFEREVTGERIRDKIAASKRKGMWMGGPVPLGYEVVDRKLVVNDAEAETVRAIYRRYLSLASVPELLRVLRAEGVITKVQQRASGPHKGGIPFARGSLFYLLKNRIYLGEIVHKGASYPGDHQAVVPQQLWDEVQAKMARGAPRRNSPDNARHLSLLSGLLHDGVGRPMAATHANKGAKRYRYYVSLKAETAEPESRWRVGAHDVEQIAVEHLASFLRDSAAVQDTLIQADAEAEHLTRSLTDAAVDADVLTSGAAWEKQKVLRRWLGRIDLKEDSMLLQLKEAERTLVVPVARVRRGHDMRLVIPASGTNNGTARDARLVELIAEAFAAREAMLHADAPTIDEVAERMGYKRKHCAQLLRLSYLAPDIIAAILDGRQPASLTRARLTTATQIPLGWAEQKALFGIA